jgi:hypothetical protein
MIKQVQARKRVAVVFMVVVQREKKIALSTLNSLNSLSLSLCLSLSLSLSLFNSSSLR